MNQVDEELAAARCAVRGHLCDVITEDGQPTEVMCSTCGKQWSVAQDQPEPARTGR